MIGAQLDLFGDRHLRLQRAQHALTEGRTLDACSELVWLRRCYPDDPTIVSELETARMLTQRLDEIDRLPAGERPRSLRDLARHAGPGLGKRLLCRAADELLHAGGACALLDGQPASALLVESGDLDRAWQVAAAAVGESGRSRFVGHLADIEHRLGQSNRARSRYRQALVDDPFDVDWDALADDNVKELPDIARSELELHDGVAWAAAVGVVLKILPLGERPALAASAPEGVSQDRQRALQNARAFLDALVCAAHDRANTLAARRRMKALAPQLLAMYLEGREARWVEAL
jgi:hypothetical protein